KWAAVACDCGSFHHVMISVWKVPKVLTSTRGQPDRDRSAPRLAKLKARDRLAQERLIVAAARAILSCRTRGNHERDEVLRPWVRGACPGSLMPCREFTLAHDRIRLCHGRGEPTIEILSRTHRARIVAEQLAQVVIAHPTTNNQDTFVAQGSKGVTHA